MTANSVLMMLGATVVALLVSVIYFYFILSPAERAIDVRMHLLITYIDSGNRSFRNHAGYKSNKGNPILGFFNYIYCSC